MAGHLRRFYTETVFPWALDWTMARSFFAQQRELLLRDVSGEVLEIGFGTGLNLPHYPPAVERLIAVDANPGMSARARRRMGASRMPVEHRVLDGERLPLADGSIDCVVSTWTMCSIAGLVAALAEMLRVLKPGGRLFFIEHGLSPDARVRRWQERLNPLQMALGDGCRLTRNFREIIPAAGFRFARLDEYYEPKSPRTHGYTYRGVAVRE